MMDTEFDPRNLTRDEQISWLKKFYRQALHDIRISAAVADEIVENRMLDPHNLSQ